MHSRIGLVREGGRNQCVSSVMKGEWMVSISQREQFC